MNRGEAAEAATRFGAPPRAGGVAVELDGSGAAFGKQFERADAAVPLSLVISDQEAEQGCVRVKLLRAEADEQTLRLDDIPALLEALG